MTDVAHEHQGTGLQAGGAAVSGGVGDVVGKPAGHRAPALIESLLERAAHQAKPVGIGENLVLGIDRRHRILAVHDARQRRLRDHVIDPGRVVAPDGAAGVDPDHHMQPVVAKHDPVRRLRFSGMAGKLVSFRKTCLRVGKRHRQRAASDSEAGHVAPAAGRERKGLVEKFANAGNHLGAADRIIARPAGIAVRRYGVGSVEGVIQAAIPGVGGVQRIAGVGDRHHKLGSGNGGNLRIDIRGFDGEVIAFRDQIADLTEKGGVGLGVDGRAGLVAKPRIDSRLHVLAYRQQFAIARRQPVNRGVETGPEAVGRDAAALEQTGIDEIGKLAGNRQVSAGNIVGHAYLQ